MALFTYYNEISLPVRVRDHNSLRSSGHSNRFSFSGGSNTYPVMSVASVKVPFIILEIFIELGNIYLGLKLKHWFTLSSRHVSITATAS